jgi:hypothetical protein
MQQVDEYKENIRSMEEEMQFYKEDMTTIQEFRVSAITIRKDLHSFATKLHTRIQVFQMKTSQIKA